MANYGTACPGDAKKIWDGYKCKIKAELADAGKASDKYINEDHYNSYCRYDYESEYGGCMWLQIYKEWKRHYIVTAVLEKLFPGIILPDLEIAEAIKKELSRKPFMFESLEKYDIVGPILAEIVKNNEQLARDIYIGTIVPATTLILQGKIDQALKMYIGMVRGMISDNKDVVQPYLDIYDIAKTNGEISHDYAKGYQKMFSIKPNPQR